MLFNRHLAANRIVLVLRRRSNRPQHAGQHTANKKSSDYTHKVIGPPRFEYVRIIKN
jgi:hypothetical protein